MHLDSQGWELLWQATCEVWIWNERESFPCKVYKHHTCKQVSLGAFLQGKYCKSSPGLIYIPKLPLISWGGGPAFHTMCQGLWQIQAVELLAERNVLVEFSCFLIVAWPRTDDNSQAFVCHLGWKGKAWTECSEGKPIKDWQQISKYHLSPC